MKIGFYMFYHSRLLGVRFIIELIPGRFRG